MSNSAIKFEGMQKGETEGGMSLQYKGLSFIHVYIQEEWCLSSLFLMSTNCKAWKLSKGIFKIPNV